MWASAVVKFVEHGDNRAGIRAPVRGLPVIRMAGVRVLLKSRRFSMSAPSTTLEWNGEVGIRSETGR